MHQQSLAGASTADLVGIAPGEAFSAEELGDLGRQFGPVQSVIVLAQHIVDPIQLVRFHASGAYEDSRIAALRAIQQDPSQGIKLLGPLAGSRRYRVGDYRIVYQVHPSKRWVIVENIRHRTSAYRR
ncbi:MAG TPA: type II toxin-antitoxin system RelE/ParE family toxin [Burkholderiales bacterium]|nr:type II toxin-antitoxin system RelE/ParE family toxin [Burkholderiales bacterium]